MIAETSDCRDFLKIKSSQEWLSMALSNFDAFLVDHAACERKASAMCMSFVVRYPDHTELLDTMIRLAREELEHFHEVYHIMGQRGLKLGADVKDDYVNQLVSLSRTGRKERLMDRLVISGIVEARGCERFYMIAEALKEVDPPLAGFYDELARSERRHHTFFIELAQKIFPKEDVSKRVEELLNAEATIIQELPLRPILH
ncbi:tRNA-(ms[2]io[6]A)-hydroxylase [bacterium]|nr:tRNA-(ms[2]io[6]A)-hydroxylase [bacterium]